MKPHSLSANDLKLGYDGRTIVEGMNVTIPDGKVSIIIGANGCGKSTLLKSFARLLNPVSGEVALDGTSVRSYPSRKLSRTLGMLPQSPVVPEGIKVADLVARGRFPYRRMLQNFSKSDREAVEEALEVMGITDLCDRSVDELSGGQRQRVWIALALAQQTDILLLDEPTTYLDIAYQVEILDTLAELNQRRGTTIVMVLHDINLSARYADWLFAMHNGRLVAQGTPEDILTPELMAKVYGLQCVVMEDPLSHTPYVLPRGRFQRVEAK